MKGRLQSIWMQSSILPQPLVLRIKSAIRFQSSLPLFTLCRRHHLHHPIFARYRLNPFETFHQSNSKLPPPRSAYHPLSTILYNSTQLYLSIIQRSTMDDFNSLVKQSKITLIGKELTDSSLPDIVKVLQKGNVEELNMMMNQITLDDTTFTNELASNTTLKVLSLLNNQISDVGAKNLSKALMKNNTLECLILRGIVLVMRVQ